MHKRGVSYLAICEEQETKGFWQRARKFRWTLFPNFGVCWRYRIPYSRAV